MTQCEFVLHEIDDPVEMDRIRRLHAEKEKRFLDYARHPDPLCFDREMQRSLFVRREAVIPHLLEALEATDHQSAEERVVAAQALTVLGHPNGLYSLLAFLQSADTELREKTWARVFRSAFLLGLDPAIVTELSGAVVRALDGLSPDQDLATKYWFWMPCSQSVAKAVLRFMERHPDHPRVGTLLHGASYEGTLQGILDEVGKRLRSSTDAQQHFSLLQALSHFLQKGDEEIRRSALSSVFLTLERPPTQHDFWHALQLLAKFGDERAIPTLEKAAESNDPRTKAWGLLGMARMLWRYGKHLNSARRQGTHQARDILDLLRECEKLCAFKNGVRPVNVLAAAVKVAAEMGTSEARQWALPVLEDLFADERFECGWALDGLSFDRFLKRMLELSLIPDGYLPADVTMACAAHPSASEWCTTMDRMGLLVLFDTNRQKLPRGHDELLQWLAHRSQGRLAISLSVEEMEDGKEGQHYAVSFVAEGRLFRFGADDFYKRYDQRSVIEAANGALRKLGHDERFIELHGIYDEHEALLFGVPSSLKVLTDEFHLTLREDFHRRTTLPSE